jgi:hypothetical protein
MRCEVVSPSTDVNCNQKLVQAHAWKRSKLEFCRHFLTYDFMRQSPLSSRSCSWILLPWQKITLARPVIPVAFVSKQTKVSRFYGDNRKQKFAQISLGGVRIFSDRWQVHRMPLNSTNIQNIDCNRTAMHEKDSISVIIYFEVRNFFLIRILLKTKQFF